MEIETTISDVGDINLIERMMEKGYVLGAEPSGHIILLDHANCSDGILTALMIIHILNERHIPLSRYQKKLKLYPQLTRNIAVSSKPPLESLPRLMEKKKQVDEILGKRGRSLIRYSGTENKLRIMLEHQSLPLIEDQIEMLATLAKEEIGE